MPSYRAPLRDMSFVLFELLDVGTHLLRSCSYFSDLTESDINAVLEGASKLAENELFPLNQSGDSEGCQFDNGAVKTPAGFANAYRLFAESGWGSLSADPAYGGQGLPFAVQLMFEEMLASSNVSFSLYPSLTNGVYKGLFNHGNEALKQRYLPKLVSGEWTGTMCLTESHAGSDLSLLRTQATPTADGHYTLSGTKIFITGGEHDLAKNIIHLVLARLPDAPAGVKGISLFLVPKVLVKDDGELGERNNVHCGSIEHKMGIRASATCVMNFDDAIGYLVGTEHDGLNAMFTIMNTERLAIGLEGLALAEIAYQNALTYAKERLQGRSPERAQPDKAADPIIVHPDVRRMLFNIKTFIEGARGLAAWVAIQIDRMQHHAEAAERELSACFVELLTPVIKAYFTDMGLEACNDALQILGGHGYISEWGIEQYVRDVRIAAIYEGTNGIQAMDLVGRKLLRDNGDTVRLFLDTINDFIDENIENNALAPYLHMLGQAVTHLEETSEWIIQEAKVDQYIAGSVCHDYLHLFGLVSITYIWVLSAKVASERIGAGSQDPFYEAKVHSASYYFQKVLPKINSYVSNIRAGSKPLMLPTAEMF